MAGDARAGPVMGTDLRVSAAEYLAVRRAMGYQLRGRDQLLGGFLDHLDHQHARGISVEQALAGTGAPASVQPHRHTARLTAVRAFAAHVHADCPQAAELIPAGLLPHRTAQAVPYLYTPAQVTGLVEQAPTLRPTVRGRTLSAVVGTAGRHRDPGL